MERLQSNKKKKVTCLREILIYELWNKGRINIKMNVGTQVLETQKYTFNYTVGWCLLEKSHRRNSIFLSYSFFLILSFIKQHYLYKWGEIERQSNVLVLHILIRDGRLNLLACVQKLEIKRHMVKGYSVILFLKVSFKNINKNLRTYVWKHVPRLSTFWPRNRSWKWCHLAHW